jgi:hypothetical protein
LGLAVPYPDRRYRFGGAALSSQNRDGSALVCLVGGGVAGYTPATSTDRKEMTNGRRAYLFDDQA